MPARFQIAWSVDCVRCSNVARRRERQKGQHVADTILAALGQAVDLPAAGEGPLNNVTIDGLDWTYYETVGGGKGASSAGSGASGMHVGMSNTLSKHLILNTRSSSSDTSYVTDPEAPEPMHELTGSNEPYVSWNHAVIDLRPTA